MLKRVFKAFEYPDFRLMWLGACTSSIGTWMQKLAQSWLVLQLSNDPRLLGLDAFLGEIPIILFSLLGGVIADRMDRRFLLIGSQLVQLTCAFLLATLFALNVVQVWHILCLSFLVGVAQAFGGPAYQALIPTLVKSEDLPNAIALNSIQFNLARVIGPMLGGLALTQLGATWCFALNGFSYIAVIISLVMLRMRFVPTKTNETILASMRTGIRFIRDQGTMTSLIVLSFLMTMLGIPIIVFLPVFARDVLGKGPEAYTLLLCTSGAGSVFGALVLAGRASRERQGAMTLRMLAALGALMIAFAFSRSLVLSCVVLFFAGAALISAFASLSSLMQLLVKDEMRGRVMSVYNVAFRGGMPIGSLVVGLMIKDWTAPVVLAGCGAALAALAAYYMVAQRKVANL